MRKRIFFALLAVVLCAMGASAQSSLLATLNHEGTISTFYGTGALQEAYKSATHGDVITLSSGSFLGTDIQKAITLRGAGMAVDTVSHTEPTVISNDFTINVSDTIGHRFTMEGIYSNQNIKISCLQNAMFLKCRFKSVVYTDYRSSKMKDLNFIHCRIAERFELATNGSASFINSIVLGTYQSTNAVFSFTNCYVDNVYLAHSEYKNCIIKHSTPGQSSSTYYNNLWICSGNFNLNSPNNTNVKITPTDERVSFLNVDYSDSNDYVLTDAVRALIKGTDGTEVGIHGGSLPYDPTPTNPQITKFNVASKSTADGKLSVDIEVNANN